VHCAEWELFISFAKMSGTFLFEWKFSGSDQFNQVITVLPACGQQMFGIKTSPHFSFPNAEYYDLFKMVISRAAEVFLRYCIVVVDLSLQR
jgi:hypothetical protein